MPHFYKSNFITLIKSVFMSAKLESDPLVNTGRLWYSLNVSTACQHCVSTACQHCVSTAYQHCVSTVSALRVSTVSALRISTVSALCQHCVSALCQHCVSALCQHCFSTVSALCQHCFSTACLHCVSLVNSLRQQGGLVAYLVTSFSKQSYHIENLRSFAFPTYVRTLATIMILLNSHFCQITNPEGEGFLWECLI